MKLALMILTALTVSCTSQERYIEGIYTENRELAGNYTADSIEHFSEDKCADSVTAITDFVNDAVDWDPHYDEAVINLIKDGYSCLNEFVDIYNQYSGNLDLVLCYFRNCNNIKTDDWIWVSLINTDSEWVEWEDLNRVKCSDNNYNGKE